MTTEGSRAASLEARSARIEVRPCRGLEEFQACVEVQKRVWGGADIDVVPLPLYVVAAETGGQVLGAFAGVPEAGNLVGFTLALAGTHQGKAFFHSHMTAVLEGYRDRGIGRQLKLLQRQDALARGIELVEWTFDPLELKNAYFNLVRLGAIVRRFLPNCYGITTSPLHGGMPTDRLMAEWWLRSPRVEKILGEASQSSRGAQHTVPSPQKSDGTLVRIHVPGGIDDIRQKDRSRALRVQREVREQFQSWLGRGYAATAVERTAEGSNYLLDPWRED